MLRNFQLALSLLCPHPVCIDGSSSSFFHEYKFHDRRRSCNDCGASNACRCFRFCTHHHGQSATVLRIARTASLACRVDLVKSVSQSGSAACNFMRCTFFFNRCIFFRWCCFCIFHIFLTLMLHCRANSLRHTTKYDALFLFGGSKPSNRTAYSTNRFVVALLTDSPQCAPSPATWEMTHTAANENARPPQIFAEIQLAYSGLHHTTQKCTWLLSARARHARHKIHVRVP